MSMSKLAAKARACKKPKASVFQHLCLNLTRLFSTIINNHSPKQIDHVYTARSYQKMIKQIIILLFQTT